MSESKLMSLGDAIFGKIADNDFLNELYDNILYNYGLTKLHLEGTREMRTIDLTPPPLPEAPAVSTTVPAASEPEPSVEPPPALAEMEEAPVKAQPEERAPQKPSAPAPSAPATWS